MYDTAMKMEESQYIIELIYSGNFNFNMGTN